MEANSHCRLPQFAMKNFLLPLGFVAFVTAWSMDEIQSRITMGSDACRHEFPHVVSIQSCGSHICGGAIVSPTFVISAAHCFPKRPPYLRVAAGMLVQRENHTDNQVVRVSQVILHPRYKHYNDIALLKLRTPLTFNEAVKPISLPKQDEEFKGKATIIGWGDIFGDMPILAKRLQCLTVRLLPIDECNRIFEETDAYPYKVTDSQICTIGNLKGQSSCRGDSGGPLIKDNKLIGLVKGGDRYCGSMMDMPSPNVFTRISRYIGFIRAYVDDI